MVFLFNFYFFCTYYIYLTEWHQTAINIFVLFSSYSFMLKTILFFFILPAFSWCFIFSESCYLFITIIIMHNIHSYIHTFLEWNNTLGHICSHMLNMKYEMEHSFHFAQRVGIFFPPCIKSEMWDTLYAYNIASSNSKSFATQLLMLFFKKNWRADGLDSKFFRFTSICGILNQFHVWCNWNRFLNGSIKPNQLTRVSGLESQMYSSANKIQLTQTNKSNIFCREVRFVSFRCDSDRFAIATLAFVH